MKDNHSNDESIKIVTAAAAIEIGFGVYDVYEAYRHGKDAIKEAMKVIGELGAEAMTATLSMEIGAAMGEGLAIAFCLTPVIPWLDHGIQYLNFSTRHPMA